MNRVDRAACGVQHHRQRVSSRAVHRVKQNPQTAPTDHRKIQPRQNRVQKCVERRVNFLGKPARNRFVKRERRNVFHPVDQLLQSRGAFRRRVPPLFGNQFDSVVGRGVVTGGDLNAVVQSAVHHLEHHQRRRRASAHIKNPQAVCAQNLRNPPRRGVGQKPTVVPDVNRFVGLSFLPRQQTNALRHFLNVAFDKIVSDYGSPTACSKTYHGFSCTDLLVLPITVEHRLSPLISRLRGNVTSYPR